MHKTICLAAEDFGHESVLKPLIQRFSGHFQIEIRIREINLRGGSKVFIHLERFILDVRRGVVEMPDALVVAIDANCKGYVEKRKELERIVNEFKAISIFAIPDPHVERWLLVDSAAFKAVFGRGCNAPQYKCERDHYKKLLRQAIRDTGVEPMLDGFEFAQEILDAMNLEKAPMLDASLSRFLEDLRVLFKQWKQG